VDLDRLRLPDGAYEYEFVLDGDQTRPVADPYADELTRFGGYRGVFHIVGGKRARPSFDWSDEFVPGKALPQNNAMVIYEMPVKWMSNDPQENPVVELGTLEKVVFEQLDRLVSLGINCIELLPIEDTSQTLDWGYGTRFFFAPDYDLGSPVDTRFFVKACHRRGVRVILDVVMNFFSTTCPLGALAPDWFGVANGTDGRNSWGQRLFRFNTAAYDDYFAAREFLYQMAEYWTTEYRVDGFRIDDFADIMNWDFGHEFRKRAWASTQKCTPGKPFIVIAEDSRRDFASTEPSAYNGGPVFDAIWNFGYKDEVRRLVKDEVVTAFGQPSRAVRVQHLISKDGVWNAYGSGRLDAGYADLACSVNYATSHDVKDGPRMMNEILGSILRQQGLGTGDVPNVSEVLEETQRNPARQDARLIGAVNFALYRTFGVFAILLTSVGMPMFLAGEEFGDVHDLDYTNDERKQQDPIQWQRMSFPGNAALLGRVGELIRLRTSHSALQRNEVEFFYFHPQFDDNAAPRVFGYARTGGVKLGSPGQVIVLANMGAQRFPVYDIPAWPWQARALTEIAPDGLPPRYDPAREVLSLGLDAFQARVFTS
jgi:1,4-alpha-glucan branching enzyme